MIVRLVDRSVQEILDVTPASSFSQMEVRLGGAALIVPPATTVKGARRRLKFVLRVITTTYRTNQIWQLVRHVQKDTIVQSRENHHALVRLVTITTKLHRQNAKSVQRATDARIRHSNP